MLHDAPSAAADLCLVSAGAFFLVGLACGAWKYACIHRSEEARAPLYVDVAHRASLLYAFACALLGKLSERSAWSPTVNAVAAGVAIAFFALSVVGYVVHGVLRDTDNQLARPHRLGERTLPAAAMTTFMVALCAGEIGGFLVVFSGYLGAVWVSVPR